MTLFQIVALYTALNLLLAPVLMFRVGQVRLSKNINLGDGGDDLMISRVRAHGNYIENAPLALLGLFAMAFMSAPAVVLHVFGAAFFLGRILHAMGMAQAFGQGRLIGTLLTLLTYVGTAIVLLYLVFTFNAV
jgi:uncharacterized membrane protein YecN with MAPEG domain